MPTRRQKLLRSRERFGDQLMRQEGEDPDAASKPLPESVKVQAGETLRQALVRRGYNPSDMKRARRVGGRWKITLRSSYCEEWTAVLTAR